MASPSGVSLSPRHARMMPLRSAYRAGSKKRQHTNARKGREMKRQKYTHLHPVVNHPELVLAVEAFHFIAKASCAVSCSQGSPAAGRERLFEPPLMMPRAGRAACSLPCRKATRVTVATVQHFLRQGTLRAQMCMRASERVSFTHRGQALGRIRSEAG